MKTTNDGFFANAIPRRTFLESAGVTLGAAALFSSPLYSFAARHHVEQKTVGEIMDLFIKEIPGAPFASTVDTLKAGDRDIKVTGIVTSMFATIDIIRQAIGLGANFIIAHEPTFYNHLDDTSWLQQDDVYQYKADLLKEHNIAVWRNHDYIHSHKPDGIFLELVKQLGWKQYFVQGSPVANIPAVSLKNLIQQTKQNLGISNVRYIGDLNDKCEKILVMPGASGGRSQITAIGKQKPDVIMCGELQEWETAEYVRDARAKGDKLSLIVLGHIASEQAGSAYMAAWLGEKVPGVKVTYLPAKASLSFM